MGFKSNRLTLCAALCLGGFIGAGSVRADVPVRLQAELAPGPVVLTPAQQRTVAAKSRVDVADWGVAPGGRKVQLVSLRDERGHELRVLTYGAIVQYVQSPDRQGRSGNVVLGFKDLKGYVDHPAPQLGATIGRVANRIANGQYRFEGKDYSLERNERGNTNHSGSIFGFSNKAWTIKDKGFDAKNSWVVLSHTDPASAGFPGNLTVDVKYNLDDQGAITMDYTAKSDADTPINLTNHNYWNLQGEGTGVVEKETLQINADRFTPSDSKAVPTGKVESVAGTVFDYRRPVVIGSRIRSSDQQMVWAHGLDENFVLNGKSGKQPRFAARVADPVSGRVLEIYTTEPALQAYTGNGLDGSFVGTGGGIYRQTDGLALETQHYPDSVHHANFPSVVLKKGKIFHSRTVWKLGVEK